MSLLPPELLAADATLNAVLASVRFSEHLNPTNIADARVAFFGGAECPPFAYAPAAWADDARRTLRQAGPPASHPLGQVVQEAIDETLALIDALDRRDAASFHRLADLCDWLPSCSDEEEILPTPPTGPIAGQIGAERMYLTLRDALRQRSMFDWKVEWDRVLSSRVLVDAPRRTIRVNPSARFNEMDRIGLVAHEVDVHASRTQNGTGQPLALFTTGLPRSLLTEEGLAIAAEEESRALSPGFVSRQALMLRAVRLAAGCGFRELWEELSTIAGSQAAFQVALRVKRGLARPDLPGVYAKDSVYLRGWRRVRAWMAAGGDLSLLYVGKVSIDQPIAEWITCGWVEPRPVPPLWRRRLNP